VRKDRHRGVNMGREERGRLGEGMGEERRTWERSRGEWKEKRRKR